MKIQTRPYRSTANIAVETCPQRRLIGVWGPKRDKKDGHGWLFVAETTTAAELRQATRKMEASNQVARLAAYR